MATKKTEEVEGGIHVEESVNKIETFFEENQNLVMGVLGAVILIVAAIVIYGKFIKAPKELEAERMVYKAQLWFEADSFKLALEGDGNHYGFYDIRDDFKSTKVGKMAKYYIGISNLHLGNLDEAIDYLEGFKTSDDNVQAVAFGAIGDAYAQKNDLSSAAEYYEKAAQKATIGAVAPTYYLRAGKAYELNGKPDAAIKMYQAIVDDYATSADIATAEKNLARLKASTN